MTLNAFAEETQVTHQNALGALPITDAELDSYYNNLELDIEEETNHPLAANVSLPSSCDLSTSPYFPPIGNQQTVGSCVAWATTYYQFTYEAHKLNNIYTTVDNAYSPRFTYNMVNGGEDPGTWLGAVYNVLKNSGSLTMEEHPYLSNGVTWATRENFDFAWSTDTDSMISALNTRISGNEHRVTVSADNVDSTELNKIRELLYSGKVLTFTTDFDWQLRNRNVIGDTGTVENYINSTTNSIEKVAYRACVDSDAGHAMTIVGYDDTVWSDINNNGQVDAGELGAFKVANSHGTTYANNGYVWVAYDALNKNTAISGDWEDGLSGDRKPVFTQGNYANYVYYIDVENFDVYYVGQLNVNTDKRNSLSVYAGSSSSNITTMNNQTTKIESYGTWNKNISHTGTLVFDYGDLCSPIGDYISGYNWYVKLNGTHNSASFKITDNLSNTIVNFGSISSGTSYMPISLSMGDLNYNGVVNDADTAIYNNAMSGTGTLSNLQEYLSSNMNNNNNNNNNTDNYTITYTTGDPWVNGQSGETRQNVQIRITNNGNAPIRNWAIHFNDFCGTPDVNSIFGGVLHGDYIVKNLIHNSDIPVNGYVDIGYTLINPSGETPILSLCNYRTASSGYEVNLSVENEFYNGFNGKIRITNTTNTPIMAWELTFDAVNFSIVEPCGQFLILNQSGSTYTLTGTYNGNIPIPANSYIELQFTGTNTGTPSLDNVSMTEVVF